MQTNPTRQDSSTKKRRIAGGLAGAVLLLAAAPLLFDACTYSLYPADPDTGAERACFTSLERWLGRTRPSDAIRSAEAITALLLVAAAGLTVRRLRAR